MDVVLSVCVMVMAAPIAIAVAAAIVLDTRGPVFYRAALSLFDFHQRTGLTGGGLGSAIFVEGPASGQVDSALTLTARGTGCSPGSSGWIWSVGDGTILSGAADTPAVTVRWPTPGNKPISARHPACGSAVGLHAVTIAGSAAKSRRR